MGSEQIQVPGGNTAGEDQAGGAQTGQARIANPGIDSLLDQIDDVLASNAQAFVDGFVQKGGQ